MTQGTTGGEAELDPELASTRPCCAPSSAARSTPRRFTRSAARRWSATTARSATASSIGARGERIIIVTDRLSAFDAVVGTIPFKGQVLNQLAQFWFEHTASIAPNHMLARARSQRDDRARVRAAAGRAGHARLPDRRDLDVDLEGLRGRRADVLRPRDLPDGMRKNQPLPQPILTPSTKAAKGDHDVSVSRDELLAMGRIAPELFDRAAELAAALFAAGQRHAASRGLILADTKYEIGIDRSRSAGHPLVIIDEIHTPDSSRYWYADDYEARLARGEEPREPRQGVRPPLARRATPGGRATARRRSCPTTSASRPRGATSQSYELVTGRRFVPDTRDPIPRIAAALGAA